jgi:glycogen(starch) synthase
MNPEVTRHPDVAVFASSFHPHVGGVEEVVRQLAHRQRARGANPLVLTMRWPKDLPATDEHEGIPVRRHIFRLPERRPRWLAAYALQHRLIERQVDAQLRAHGARIIHVHCVSGNALYALRASRRLRLPLVASLHGELTMDADNVYETSSVLPRLLRSVLQHADAVTACSRHTLQEAEASTGIVLGERGRVVANGVDLREIRSAPPERMARPYILALGRHVRQKGFDALLDAYSDGLGARAGAPDLVIAGDGPELPALQARASSLGLSRRVHFPGRCDRSRTAALFNGCEFFVLPSRHEPFGIVCLEAMAAGKATVATRVGGVPEVVADGSTGLLVPPDDRAALAGALDALCAQPLLRRRLEEGAESSVPRFDWTQITSIYADIYDAIVEARASAVERASTSPQ